jgi:NTE family protein
MAKMIGLVLEGGGAKGAYHIGAYRALSELGIQIDAVVGTSIGAINGAIIAQGDGHKAWDIWAGMQNSTVFEIDRQLDERLHLEGLTRESVSQVAKLVKKLIAEGGIDTTRIKAFITEHIDEARVRQSAVDFGLATFSLSDRSPLELMVDRIPEGQLHDYVLASATVPGFKTGEVDGKQFVDGGIWNNLPLSLLVDRGYDTLIAVRTGGIGRIQKVDHFATALVEITPSEKLGPFLDFNRSAERKGLTLGYLDTMRIYRKLIGRRYYIEPHPDREWFFRVLADIPKERILEAGELLGLAPMPARRMMFEGIVPKVAAIFELDDNLDYQDLVLAIYEYMAEKLEIDRLQIYSSRTFLETVRTRFLAQERMVPGRLMTLAKKDPLLARLVKDDLLDALLLILLPYE